MEYYIGRDIEEKKRGEFRLKAVDGIPYVVTVLGVHQVAIGLTQEIERKKCGQIRAACTGPPRAISASELVQLVVLYSSWAI